MQTFPKPETGQARALRQCSGCPQFHTETLSRENCCKSFALSPFLKRTDIALTRTIDKVSWIPEVGMEIASEV